MIDMSYKYYFIDFFGTILDRICSPDDIKRIWSNRMSILLSGAFSSKQLYDIRISAEKYICSQNEYAEFLYDDLAREIYNRLEVLLDYSIDMLPQNDFCNLSRETEIQIEVENQKINQRTINLIKQLKHNQKKVFILSDYYFEAEVLKYFLKKKDIDILFEGIIVSCELMCNKSSGSIYKKICEKYGIHANECYMFGDTYKSDFLNAKGCGFGAGLVKRSRNSNKTVNARKVIRQSMERKSDLGLSYTNYSYMLFKFVFKLYCELNNKKYTKVYFLSREGEFLKKIFDSFCLYMEQNYGKSVIHSEYLYVSRQATFPATLNEKKIDDFKILFENYPNLSVNAFLKNIGFGETERKHIEKMFPHSFYRVVPNLAKSREYQELIDSEEFQKLYFGIVKRKKMELHQYLSEKSFLESNRVAVVDVGWKGSIQDFLWLSENKEINIEGYYCGLKNNARCSLGNSKKGLVFSDYLGKNRNYTIWSYDSNFLERLFSASHPSVNGYSLRREGVAPKFNSFGSEENNYNLIKPIQKEIYEHFKMIVPMIFSLPILSDELENELAYMHIKACCNIHRSNMVLQQKLMEGQVENFGFQEINGNRLKGIFTIRNIISKLKKNIKLLLNVHLLINVCNSKKLYNLSVIISRAYGKYLERELRKG